MARRAQLLMLLAVLAVTGCGGAQATPAASADLAAVASASAPAATPSPTPAPTPSATPDPTATPVPTATPTPTPSPTPVPWKTHTSKRFKYSMKYPPDYIVTPGNAKRSDMYDDFVHYVYVNRDTVPGTVSIARTVSSENAYMKSHYKGKVLTNKPIRLSGGYRGRIVTYNVTNDGRKEYAQIIMVGKGRAGYFLEMWTDRGNEKADRALFKQFYKTWRPK